MMSSLRNHVLTTFALLCLALILPSASASPTQGNIFPALEGWKQGAISSYSPENLYVPIDGAADLFLRYNFEEMRSVEYGNGTETFTVEAYRHATPLDAYGIYSQGRPAKDVYIDIGMQAYAEADLLNFVAGRHYVEMRTSTPNEKSLGAMRTIAKRMAEALNGGAKVPDLFACFPTQGRKPYSEKYVAKDILGYDFLRTAFQVEYETAGKTYMLYAMRGEKEGDAAKMMQTYFTQLKMPAGSPVEGFIVVNDKYHGDVSLWKTGRYLLCASGSLQPDESKALLAGLKSQIEKTKE
jgi:hypothetical protein